MCGAIDWLVLLVVDALDDVSLFAHTSIRENGVRSGKIFQIGLE